jgi:hypothetical protein
MEAIGSDANLNAQWHATSPKEASGGVPVMFDATGVRSDPARLVSCRGSSLYRPVFLLSRYFDFF